MDDIKLITNRFDRYVVSYKSDIYNLFKDRNTGCVIEIDPSKKSYFLPNKLEYRGIIYHIFFDARYSYLHCTNLEEFILEKNLYGYIAYDGVLYYGQCRPMLTAYPVGKKNKYFFIPKGIDIRSKTSWIDGMELNPYLKYIYYKNRLIIKDLNQKYKIL